MVPTAPNRRRFQRSAAPRVSVTCRNLGGNSPAGKKDCVLQAGRSLRAQAARNVKTEIVSLTSITRGDDDRPPRLRPLPSNAWQIMLTKFGRFAAWITSCVNNASYDSRKKKQKSKSGISCQNTRYFSLSGTCKKKLQKAYLSCRSRLRLSLRLPEVNLMSELTKILLCPYKLTNSLSSAKLALWFFFSRSFIRGVCTRKMRMGAD